MLPQMDIAPRRRPLLCILLAIAACGSLYPATCDPASNNWSFSAPANTPGGKLQGFEVNVQVPFRFLPSFLHNTGVLLNYTGVKSDINYENGAGAVVDDMGSPGIPAPDSAQG